MSQRELMNINEERIVKLQKLMTQLEVLDVWDSYDHQIYDFYKYELKTLLYKQGGAKDENI